MGNDRAHAIEGNGTRPIKGELYMLRAHTRPLLLSSKQLTW